MVVNKKDGKIICLNFDNGKKHDFKLFIESRIAIEKKTAIYGDSGYQGICKLHNNSLTPQKASKKHKLTKEEKRNNREISRKRILIENVIGKIKIFRILAERYRNRRKRYNLRFNLIAGIYNFERM